MRRFALTALTASLLLPLAVVACSDGPSGTTTGPSPTENLETATGTSWVLDFHPTFGTLRFAMPKGKTSSITAGKNPTEATLAFLAAHRDLFKIDVRDVKPESVVTDDINQTHVTFAQTVRGVPVRGARITVHLAQDGTVSYLNGLWAPSAEGVATQPAVPEATAIATAKAEVKKRFPSFDDTWLDTPPPTSMRIALDGGKPALVYEVFFPMMFTGTELRYSIDARSGAVVRVTDELLRVAATGKGVRAYALDGRKNASDIKSFVADEDKGTYTLFRPASKAGTELAVLRFGFRNKVQRNRPLTSTDPNRWDETGRGPGSGVDAFVTMAKVDAFFQKLGRKSYDGQGGRLDVVVHQWEDTGDDTTGNGYGEFEWGKDNRFMCNAFFSSHDRIMAFGDGTYRHPKDDGTGCMPLSGSLDIAAHEYTHGIVHHTLELDYQGEAAALNESFADIFGAFVEHADAPNQANNVRIGEDGMVGATVIPLRNMQDPKDGKEWGADSPTHVSELPTGNLESHRGSNLPSHAFYLMTFGGTNAVSGIGVENGIGWDKALTLYWSVLTTSKMSSTATFHDTAEATIADAKSRGIDQKPVVCAWRAVGVLSKSEVEQFGSTCTNDKGDPDAGPPPAGDAGTGDAPYDAAPSESCGGKPDGIYCSALHPYGAMVCKDGLLQYGLQCPTPQLCVGPNGPGTTIQCK